MSVDPPYTHTLSQTSTTMDSTETTDPLLLAYMRAQPGQERLMALLRLSDAVMQRGLLQHDTATTMERLAAAMVSDLNQHVYAVTTPLIANIQHLQASWVACAEQNARLRMELHAERTVKQQALHQIEELRAVAAMMQCSKPAS